MALSFPNSSRSFDATRRAIRFWGHDRSMEASFFVNEDALKRIQPNIGSDEAGLLSAFDLQRERIYAIAALVYGRGRKGSYDLLPADF
ncbi:MAG: DUF1488 domain-containing protein [Xanthobacteraceae bacterium]